MAFQPDPDRIVWRLHLAASPERVFAAIDSAEGRAGFWAEEAVEEDGVITFSFPGGETWRGAVVVREPPSRWGVEYFGSVAEFHLESDGSGGTDLTLVDTGVAPDHRTEVAAGWLNVLLPLKAWVDHGVDLRNHDPRRTWAHGYVDQ
ncbi:MAG: SRPBCC domain-containing protein [Acidimicrobiia bacterium]|nr:SRPBCC domain-containing protein [Acidimicrobiia bacterium]